MYVLFPEQSKMTKQYNDIPVDPCSEILNLFAGLINPSIDEDVCSISPQQWEILRNFKPKSHKTGQAEPKGLDVFNQKL